jgi:hypothetical protein
MGKSAPSINPVVSLGFSLMRKLDSVAALVVRSQLAGGVLGSETTRRLGLSGTILLARIPLLNSVLDR